VSKLALYARVSTSEQSVDNQLPQLIEYAERRAQPTRCSQTKACPAAEIDVPSLTGSWRPPGDETLRQ